MACPGCGETGKAIQTVTLKCLLKPAAMPRLAPESAYQFCPVAACEVVYFSSSQPFSVSDVQVPVFQKDKALDTPVCYCFGITRGEIEMPELGRLEEILALVKTFVQAGKCACEYRNPQGRCCLGNLVGVKVTHADQ